MAGTQHAVGMAKGCAITFEVPLHRIGKARLRLLCALGEGSQACLRTQGLQTQERAIRTLVAFTHCMLLQVREAAMQCIQAC